MKILLVSLSVVIIAGLLAFVINGQIVPKTRSIIKVSGFKDKKEVGKFVYRQLYGRLVYVENIIFSAGTDQLNYLPAIIEGFQQERARLGHEEWLEKPVTEFEDEGSEKRNIYFSLAESYFRASVQKPKLKSKTIFIHLDYLYPPSELEKIPSMCDKKENFFLLDCIKSRISMVAKGKWQKVRSCFKATLDQVASKDYLILVNEGDCNGSELRGDGPSVK